MKYYIYEIKQCATKLISEIKTTMNHIWNLQHSLTPTSRNSGTGTPFQVILQLLITAKNEQEEKKLSLRRNSDIDKPIGSANTPYRQPMHIADDKPIGIIKNGHQQSIHFVDGNTSFLPSRNSDADAPTVVTLSSEEMLQLEMLQLGREAKTIESVLLFYFSTENEGDVFHHRQYHQLNQTLPWPFFNEETQASISDSYVGHYLQPRNTTIQHIVVLPSPLKLIVEFQASKLLASSSEGEYHILQVLSIVDSDPALLLIVGFNSFPRPPENEGEYQSSSSSTSSSTPAVPRPVSSTSVYEGEETASKPLPFDTVCEGEEKKHKMSWLSRKNRTQAITTTQIQSRTFVAAALFCISVAMATANGNINGRIDSSNIVRDIGSIGSSSSGTSAATSAAQRQQQQQHRLHSSQWQWLRRLMQTMLINRAQHFTRRIFSQEVVSCQRTKTILITSWELSAKPSSTRSFVEKESTICFMCIISTYVRYWYTSAPIGSRDLAQTSSSQVTMHRNSGNIFKYSFRGSVRIHELQRIRYFSF